jgi:hypothetical protein
VKSALEIWLQDPASADAVQKLGFVLCCSGCCLRILILLNSYNRYKGLEDLLWLTADSDSLKGKLLDYM